MEDIKPIGALNVSELKLCLNKHKIPFKSNSLKAELVELITKFASEQNFRKIDPTDPSSDYAININNLPSATNLTENSHTMLNTPEPLPEVSSVAPLGQTQTSFQQTNVIRREPSFSEVIKMTSVIRFCESRSPVAIENLITEVSKFRLMANFSDVTSNLVLQIRCSSEILEMAVVTPCLLYTSPSPRDGLLSRMPSSA